MPQEAAEVIRAYVFDAYGTLFDVHSAVRRHAAAIGPQSARLSEIWRTKQLEFTWVRSLMGRYRDFLALTEEALDYAVAVAAPAQTALKPALMAAYRELDAYPEVAGILRKLREAGMPVLILSNGTPDMLASAVASAGLADLVDAVISVDALQTYKTDPRAYELVTRRLGMAPADISFQSSNRWDIAGAVAFGFRAVWVNRNALPDEYPDLPPDAEIATLADLPRDA